MGALHGSRDLEEVGVGSAGAAKLEAFERMERDVVYNTMKEVQQSSHNRFHVRNRRLRAGRDQSSGAMKA